MRTDNSAPDRHAGGRFARSLLLGVLIVGTLDALDAMVFGYVSRGTVPGRVFQGIASGWLGRASFAGGWPTVIAGVLIHYTIALSVVLTYHTASTRFPLLTRRRVACGAVYGIGVYAFMNAVVIPLSAIGPLPFRWPAFVNGVLIHIVGVGIPAALTARRRWMAPAAAPDTGMWVERSAAD